MRGAEAQNEEFGSVSRATSSLAHLLSRTAVVCGLAKAAASTNNIMADLTISGLNRATDRGCSERSRCLEELGSWRILDQSPPSAPAKGPLEDRGTNARRGDLAFAEFRAGREYSRQIDSRRQRGHRSRP